MKPTWIANTCMAVLALSGAEVFSQQIAPPKTERYVATGPAFSVDLTRLSKSSLTPRPVVSPPGEQNVVCFDGDPQFRIAIACRKIHPDAAQDDSFLDTQKQRLEELNRSLGDLFTLYDTTSGERRRLLAYTLDGQSYDKATFPFEISREPVGYRQYSIGGHQCLVRNGYLFEISCVLLTGIADANERRSAVIARLDQARLALDFPRSGG